MYYSEMKIEKRKKLKRQTGKRIDENEIARAEIELRERKKNCVENSIQDFVVAEIVKDGFKFHP